MPRPKGRPAKRKAEDAVVEPIEPSGKLPKEVEEEFKRAQKRFLFNVDQIEEKYCTSTSGIVLNFDTDELEFHENLCTAKDENELSKLVKRQMRSLSEKKFGGSLLSTPALDPEEKNQEQITRWRKLNKAFDDSFEKEEKNAKGTSSSVSNEKMDKCMSLVKYGQKAVKKSHQVQRKMSIDINSVEITGVDFGMIERFHRFGGLDPKDLKIILEANKHIPAAISSGRKMLAIEDAPKDEDEKEKENREENSNDPGAPCCSSSLEIAENLPEQNEEGDDGELDLVLETTSVEEEDDDLDEELPYTASQLEREKIALQWIKDIEEKTIKKASKECYFLQHAEANLLVSSGIKRIVKLAKSGGIENHETTKQAIKRLDSYMQGITKTAIPELKDYHPAQQTLRRAVKNIQRAARNGQTIF